MIPYDLSISAYIEFLALPLTRAFLYTIPFIPLLIAVLDTPIDKKFSARVPLLSRFFASHLFFHSDISFRISDQSCLFRDFLLFLFSRQKTNHILHLTMNDVKWDKCSVQVIDNLIREKLGKCYNPLDMK